MKEWRINLTYKLILFTIFLITPFILFVILNGINLIVQRFIVIYTLEILIFLLSYIVYEVRVRSFYNRLVQKTILLNDQYEIKNSKFFKFLGLDSFSSFEYFFNEELDKVFAELDYYKSGYFKNEEKKGTEIESNKIELDNKIKELEQKIIFTHWGPYNKDSFICRFVTSWATTKEQMDFLEGIL